MGWDASGVVEAVGSEVKHYKVGDEVYFAGSITREGCFAEYTLVDERYGFTVSSCVLFYFADLVPLSITGRKPKNLSWEQAAAEPLTVLTAWEGITERMAVPIPAPGTSYKNPKTLLVIAGAGGVGSTAIQLGKHVLGLRVVATAVREETIKYCKELGADYTIKHGEPLLPQLKALGIDGVDYVMHCWEAHTLWDELPAVINPLGKLSFLTTGEELKIKPFMTKGIAVCPELMHALFVKVLPFQNLIKLFYFVADTGLLVPFSAMISRHRGTFWTRPPICWRAVSGSPE